MKQALEENETNRVLVHCNRGISRSASFVCAYMIAEAKMDLEEALTYGQLNRDSFQPNKNFLSQLGTFAKLFCKPTEESNTPDMSAAHLNVLMRQLTNQDEKGEKDVAKEMDKMNLEEKKEWANSSKTYDIP